MTIDAFHKQHADFAPVWKKCRDAAGGQRKVHEGGELYLPKLHGQTPEAYNAYKLRASFFNATGRTVDGFAGVMFRKQGKVELPGVMGTEWQNDINLSGRSLEGFVREAVDEVLIVGRAGILVDHPPAPVREPGTALTVDQSRQLDLRPYLTLYKAESIRNWKMDRVGNVTKLTWVTLTEFYHGPDGNAEEQIRELTLESGAYVQNVWKKDSKGKWVITETVVPVKGNSPMTDIPFFFLAPKEPDCCVQKPPIEDLADVNLSHYRNSADLENGAHLSGIPTPWAAGVDEGFVFALGGAGLALPNGGEVGFLQCGGEGFATLEKLLDRKEDQMAALGARMLAPEKRQAEAAETLNTKRGGENSVLATLAGAVEMQIKKALQFMADWAKLAGEVIFEMNKDYVPTSMTSQDIMALLATWQAGGISDQTFFEGLQAGEIISEGVSFDDENDRKQESGPKLGTLEDNEDDNG